VLIQKELNDYFRAWFALPENFDHEAERLARNPEWWASLAHPWSLKDDPLLPSDSKIPAHFHPDLRKLYKSKTTKEVTTSFSFQTY
jgi:hypothetical protein